MIAKCPKCDKMITHMNAVAKDVWVNGKPSYKGVLFCCNWCNTALSGNIDQVAIKADLLAKIR